MDNQTEVFSECDKHIERKAAKLNLTVGQLWVALELAEDIDRISQGRIQPMCLIRVGQTGCVAKFHSMEATYYVWIDQTDLLCVQERYGKEAAPVGIYRGKDSIPAWETIRHGILAAEGCEYESPQPQNTFDTCQNMQIQTEAEVVYL